MDVTAAVTDDDRLYRRLANGDHRFYRSVDLLESDLPSGGLPDERVHRRPYLSFELPRGPLERRL